MSTYHRTAIRRLAVQGYRSLKDVVLEDLPDVVVLHGPNGAGKSNLLRAAQLLLEAVVVGHGFAFGPRGVISLPLPNASTALGLRPSPLRHRPRVLRCVAGRKRGDARRPQEA